MTTQQREPSEFRYWENLDKPWARRLRAVGRRLLGFDPAPPEEVVRKFASMYYDADPLAEAFVEEVYVKRGMDAGRAMLDQALRGGVESVPDAPASLIELFADIERDPDWVDPELVEIGARLRRRWEYGAHVGATRLFTPPWTYKHNELPSSGLWALHPLARAPFIFTAETLRRRFPSLESVADRVARRSRERWFAHHMDGREAKYRPAQNFTR